MGIRNYEDNSTNALSSRQAYSKHQQSKLLLLSCVYEREFLSTLVFHQIYTHGKLNITHIATVQQMLEWMATQPVYSNYIYTFGAFITLYR